MRSGRFVSCHPRGVRPVAVLLAAALASTPVAAQEPMPVRVESQPVVAETLPIPAELPAPPPLTAPVQPGAAVDTVVLRDGSILRGTVAEVYPDRHVTIVSATGQRHTIGWDQIADLNYSGQAVAPELVAGPGRPHLHIETTRPAAVRLFEISPQLYTEHLSWGNHRQIQQVRPVCRAPCDRVIDGSAGQSFVFGGEGINPSRRFTFDEHEGPLLARVRPGRAGVFVGGVVLTSLSVAPLISGTLFLSLAHHTAPDGSHSTRNAGIALSAVAFTMLVSGIIMVARGRTKVELYRRHTAQRRPKPARG